MKKAAEVVGAVVMLAGLVAGFVYGARRFALRKEWPGEIYDIEDGEPYVS